MPTPDPRPAGETARALLGQIRAQVCCCEDAAELDIPEQVSAARAEMDRLLDAYRDAVAAEARAVLLDGAPTVWAAAPSLRSSRRRREIWIFTHQPSEPVPGEFVGHGVLADDALAATLATPPGTCVRYRLVPDPEEP